MYSSQLAVFDSGFNKAIKQRVRPIGAAFKLWVELYTYKPRMFRVFHNLNKTAVWRLPDEFHPAFGLPPNIGVRVVFCIPASLKRDGSLAVQWGGTEMDPAVLRQLL